MFGFNSEEKAFLAPFAAFLALLALGGIVHGIGEGFAAWPLAEPQYWINPAQTILCAALLARGWRCYGLRAPARPVIAIGIGVLALALWIAPQELFARTPRTAGFLPHFFGENGAPYALNTALRFVRLVVVVPLVEEIFWRGFLLRYLIDHHFTRVPIGAFSWKSCAIVSVCFALEHQPADYPAALLTGALYNVVAYRTRSLSACVLAHAITNLLLGIYVMKTGQWGFW